jgi:prevent-host-death family protein
MSKTFSVTEAKNHLSRLIHHVEEEGPVRLTRRGRPVAVVISVGDYQKFQSSRPGLMEAIAGLRSDLERNALDIDPDEIFGSVRSHEPGRDFSW